MNTKKIAGIDLGSNTILMLIADIDSNNNLKYIRDENSIARLGEGVNQYKIINQNAIDRSVEILKEYKKICIEEKVDEIIACGTSAMRDATNGEQVAEIFSNILDAKVEIISGDEEARLTFIGAIENTNRCTIIDIGGGSTEFITGENNEIEYKYSINIGAVRIKEMFFNSHPPKNDELIKAKKFILQNLSLLDKANISNFSYAVAGSPTSIAGIHLNLSEFDYDKIHLFKLYPQIINDVWDIILSHSVDEIIKKYNMHPRRADIISAGVLILKTTLEYFNNLPCVVSVKGLRYGIIKNYLNKKLF